MTSSILVTGGTGTLGRQLIPHLREDGRVIRVLSRSRHEATPGIEFVTGDLAKDEGIEEAVQGAGIIVHCAGTSKGDETKARHLVQAASKAGARHLVFISVVGADRIPIASAVDRAMFGYFGSKLGAEKAIAESGVPWTTLRSTQFHDGILTTVRAMSKMPVVPVPVGTRFQPVDTDEVARRLAELTLSPPAGLVPEMGGPRAYELKELVRSYLKARGKHRPIMPMRPPGKAARAIREGANLTPGRAVGRRTWENFLAEHLDSQGASNTDPR
jgi:uncharacterized protein YbjT (DUF2867 family)